MKIDPAKPLVLDALALQALSAADFREVDVRFPDNRAGWAPPRRRPRRVYKKLAARGFMRHSRSKLVTAGADAQVERRRVAAPELRAWLETSGSELAVHFKAIVYDGQDFSAGPEDGRDRVELVRPALLPSPIDLAAEPDPDDKIVYLGRCIGAEATVREATIQGRIIVYLAPAAGDDPPASLLIQALYRVGEMLAEAAKERVTTTRVLARQTTYRGTR